MTQNAQKTQEISQIQEVLPHIYRIPVPLPNNPLRELNAYLIREEGRDLLIDTGFRREECRAALSAGLAALHVRRDTLEVLLTHLHADHSGLCTEFAGPEMPVYLSAADLPWMMSATHAGLEAHIDREYLRAGFSQEAMDAIDKTHPGLSLAAPKDFPRYRPLSDGDVLERGGYRLRAIHTPGHTPGHMCFYLAEQKAMFTGDHVLFDITPNITCWAQMEDSLGQYLKSLRAIRQYDVQLALPAHRGSGDFDARIAALLAHHEKRLAECRAVVAACPGLCAYDIAGRMTWKIRAASWEEFPVSQRWFAVGECMSHLDRLRAENRVRREWDGSVYRYFTT